MKWIVLIVLVLLAACGRNGVFDNTSPSTPFLIDYTEATCSTGRHGFTEKAAYCEALRSKSLNNNCAFAKRKKAYEPFCGPVFLEAP